MRLKPTMPTVPPNRAGLKAWLLGLLLASAGCTREIEQTAFYNNQTPQAAPTIKSGCVGNPQKAQTINAAVLVQGGTGKYILLPATPPAPAEIQFETLEGIANSRTRLTWAEDQNYSSVNQRGAFTMYKVDSVSPYLTFLKTATAAPLKAEPVWLVTQEIENGNHKLCRVTITKSSNLRLTYRYWDTPEPGIKRGYPLVNHNGELVGMHTEETSDEKGTYGKGVPLAAINQAITANESR